MISSLERLLDLMRHHGATRIYAKKLSPNDNSKNQVYLGNDFGALNIIPHGEIYTDSSERAGSKRERPKAPVTFFWIDEDGQHPAPDANLILYPDYPEVRMSGFLNRCKASPSHIMTVRDEGRALFMGITADGRVLGYAAEAANPITVELNGRQWETLGVFLELPLSLAQDDPKTILIRELRRIYELNWVMSQKLAKDGVKQPYAARNAGGMTLEAELGIMPNSYAEPDFMGWEVKQYSVRDFIRFAPKSAVTLMTPEPTGGFYRQSGSTEFVKRFGYADKSGKEDRINFGGIYTCQKPSHAATGLRMTISGYDANAGVITNIDGGFSLITAAGEEAASWSFAGMMKHWNRKHAQAAYVPSLHRKPPPEYSYGPRILLCERTDFFLFLKAFAIGVVYYDPAIKLENASGPSPDLKPRSQFRVRHSNLTQMYHQHETVLLTG